MVHLSQSAKSDLIPPNRKWYPPACQCKAIQRPQQNLWQPGCKSASFFGLFGVNVPQRTSFSFSSMIQPVPFDALFVVGALTHQTLLHHYRLSQNVPQLSTLRLPTLYFLIKILQQCPLHCFFLCLFWVRKPFPMYMD